MKSKFTFFFRRLGENLWARPLLFCAIALLATIAAHWADGYWQAARVPRISPDTVDKLLSIMASSMLGVATFAVASMVAAYASASTTATPRAFALVVVDDVSKTALSTFIAAFMFSILSLIALHTGYYGKVGLLTIFTLTVGVILSVIFTFIRWTDKIARLGRLGATIDRVEAAAAASLEVRRLSPLMNAMPLSGAHDAGTPVYAPDVGYVQHVDFKGMQEVLEDAGATFRIRAQPGAFIGPGRPLGVLIDWTDANKDGSQTAVMQRLVTTFTIGGDRIFDEDPRFGLIVLSEIAARALSPAVNDPGTAIDILGTLVRLLTAWSRPLAPEDETPPLFNRIEVQPLTARELLDDGFTAIARDGAGTIEVVVRLLKAYEALTHTGHADLSIAARAHAGIATRRAELELRMQEEIELLSEVSGRLIGVGADGTFRSAGH